MDGILSQDEINALLSGMDLSSTDSGGGDAPSSDSSAGLPDQSILSDIEKDAVGEVANISMGTSATTLYSLVNQKVNITTPTVTISNWDTIINSYDKPCVFISIKYTIGLDGSNILILKENDVKIITDLMMGGDGSNTEGELGEIHLSAISEAMNQMMGSSATSLSSMLGKKIDISPPEASLVDLIEFKSGDEIANFLAHDFVAITFRMQIGDLVDSQILQLYPIDFAKSLYEIFINQQMGDAGSAEPEPAPAPAPEPMASAPAPESAPTPTPSMQQPDPFSMPQPDPSMMMNPMMNPMMNGMYGYPPMMPQQSVNVQQAQFQNFNTQSVSAPAPENIGLIMDVPLEVTVELGRTKKSISDILDFAPGTIIELDKIAGEPIDVLVNGKFVAKGEVVVIEESFGIRITEIIK